MTRFLRLSFLLFLLSSFLLQAQPIRVDVCVYGGTSAGVIAAYSTKKSGKLVVLIEPERHLGGMSSGGLGATDIGNKQAITGLSRNFYRRISQHYGQPEQWTFEPHVAEAVFNQYIKEADVTVLYEYQLASAKTQNNQIQEILLESSRIGNSSRNQTVQAKQFIDCFYEGDLMVKAGVAYNWLSNS